jgi:hypothetical protein
MWVMKKGNLNADDMKQSEKNISEINKIKMKKQSNEKEH